MINTATLIPFHLTKEQEAEFLRLVDDLGLVHDNDLDELLDQD